MSIKKVLLVLAILWLLAVSIFPRVVEVLNRNFIFLLDQGRDYMAVKNIVVDHKLTLIGAEVGGGMAGLQGLFHGPFYFYLLSIPFVVFGADPYGGLLVMFLFGMLTIGAGFYFGKKTLGFFGAFIMTFLIALSPPLISQSRFIWSPHPAAFFIILAFYCAYRAYEMKKRFLFLAAFFTGFIYNFEFAMAVPMSIAFFLYTLFLIRKRLQLFVFVAGGFIVAYSPLILFNIRHGFQALKGMVTYFSHAEKLSIKIDHLAFFRNFFDTFPHQQIIPPFLFLFIFVTALLYFISQEKKKNMYYFIFFLIGTWIITFLISIFVKTTIFEYYLIHINIIIIFLFSYIFVRSFEKKKIFFQTIFTVFFGTFLFYGTVNSIDITRRDYSDLGGMSKIKGKIEAIDYIYKDAKGREFGLLIFAPPIYTYQYDYLIWWHGERKYHYLPHKNKSGLFYLLIEKDLGKWWTYKGWFETVVKTGKVIETKELPSGFIIQKRIDE